MALVYYYFSKYGTSVYVPHCIDRNVIQQATTGIKSSKLALSKCH
uniref:Uncharacterized protein n=1 Tax=Arundo donax TaxID=35708 RepID=A0A0A8YU66_ARUDO